MDCHFEKQQVSVYQLGLCGTFIRALQGFDSISPLFPQSYVSVEIKRLFPVLDNNFRLFLFFQSVENNAAYISYKIFAVDLPVIAVDLYFDDCFSFHCGESFVEYLRNCCGTTAVHFRVEG